MEILEHIEDQLSATHMPLVGITLAAVACPDTPVILTLHWHGFGKVTLADVDGADVVTYTPVPSSSLQLNMRWRDLRAVDHAAMEAGWALGAWDVAREEQPGCLRPGADPTEHYGCMQAFGTYPHTLNGQHLVVSDAPDAEDLMALAAAQGYLSWTFRPVSGGIWRQFADDATLSEEGRRALPCPHAPQPPRCKGQRRTVYRFGIPSARLYPVKSGDKL